MMSNAKLRALVGIAVVGMISLIAAPAVQAQPTPAGNPQCGSVAGLMHHTIASLSSPSGTPVGRNIVSVPRVSPIQGSPSVATNNGFHKICRRLGFTSPGPAGQDIDGDLAADSALLTQFDPQAGTAQSFNCGSTNAPTWDTGSGVQIEPSFTASATRSMFIPGVECSQRYAVYDKGLGALGKQIFPIPLSTTCADRGCLCDQLNLADNTVILTIDAVVGNAEQYVCLTPRALDSNRTPLPAGEAAVIEPQFVAPGAGSPAPPINCLSGAPCPATPNADYPQPLVY